MIRTTTDDRLRRVCAILIGMSVLAVSVGTVTIMIHDGMHWLRQMNQPDIYRKAIQRTFAELYSVPAEAVHVAWTSEAITVHCAGRTFTRKNASEDNEFVSEDEDPVTVTLTDDECYHLERSVLTTTSQWLREGRGFVLAAGR
jgi:hypothetical protein